MAGPVLRWLCSSSHRFLSSSHSSSYHLKSHIIAPSPGLRPNLLSRTFSAANSALDPCRLRNVAVIAHAALMDRLLRHCGSHERAISLERERAVVIGSEVTSFSWKENELNMINIPGHMPGSDYLPYFPVAEAKRVVRMVEGAIFVVDAAEGRRAQTKFSLAKAILKYRICPILLLNNVDRPTVSEKRCSEVVSFVLDLFANLGATEEQLAFPVLYSSVKEGWASNSFTKDPPAESRNMSQLIDAIIKHVPPPTAKLDAPFQMLVSAGVVERNRAHISIGRIVCGVVHTGDRVHALRIRDFAIERIEEGQVVKLMKKKVGNFVEIDRAGAGDIVSMVGLENPVIGDTVANVESFAVNGSPLAGPDGKFLKSFEDYWKEFESWMSKHNKTYQSDEEKLRRFKIFVDRSKHVEKRRRENCGYRVGLNQFSDMSYEECSRKLCGAVPSRGSHAGFSYIDLD